MTASIRDERNRLRVREVFFGFRFLQLARFEDLFAIQALHKFAVFIVSDDLGAGVRAGLRHALQFSEDCIVRSVSGRRETGRPACDPTTCKPKECVCRASLTAIRETFRSQSLRLF